MPSITWEVRRSAHIEELRMELQCIREDWNRHVAAGDARLARYERMLNRAVEIIETPPPMGPAPTPIRSNVVTFPQAA